MSSAIDSSKPADGTPAVKADLRANLEAARVELNHGGFATTLTPDNYGPVASDKVEDHLAAIDDAFGAIGDAGTFTGLADTPGGYAGEGSKFVKVKTDESGLEFVTSGGATNADAVDYDPPWPGVVTHSVESRLMAVRTPEDFGAVGDGASDDSAAIQAAVDVGEGTVVFGAKTYALGTQITVPQGIMLELNGTTLTAHGTLATSGDASTLLYFNGAEPNSQRGCGIRGHGRLTPGGRALYGVRIDSAGGGGAGKHRFKIDGSHWISFGAGFLKAIFCTNFWDAKLSCLHISPPADDGVAIDWQDGDGTKLQLDHVTVNLTGSTGTIGVRVKCETFHFEELSVDGCPSDGWCVHFVGADIGASGSLVDCHFESNQRLFTLDGDSAVNVTLVGGIIRNVEGSGDAIEIGSNAVMMWLGNTRTTGSWDAANLANIASSGVLGIYNDRRDFSSGSFSGFTGSGQAYQVYLGNRISLHNS